MSFTIGSLFDGSGGFPLAATMCGGIPKWASEIEPYPIAVTKSRFPNMKHLGSVTDINGAYIEPVDIISFGSPCQDLSVAGKRAGLKHEANGDDETTRSGLFMEAVRIIKEMREATNGVYPRFAVWENVPGAFSSNKGEDFHIVLEELIKVIEPTAVMPSVPKNGWPYADSYCGDGWSLAYRVLDARYWGVPQRRRRIYLVADFRGRCAGKILFEREGLRGYFTEGRTPWQGTSRDAADCAGADDCEKSIVCVATQQGGAEIRTDDKAPTLTAAAGMSENNRSVVVFPYTLKIRSGCEGGDKGPLIQENKSATLSCNNDQPLFEPCGWDGGQVSPTLTKQNAGGNQRMPDKDNFTCVLQPFGISSKDSNAMKSDNPHSGIYEAETSRTLDANGGNPGCNQGGIAVVESYSIQGSMIGREDKNGPQGDGVNEDVSFTLNTVDRHAVYAMTTGSYTQVEEETAPTLMARDFKDRATGNCGCTVRRLTPTECARLQGFPDAWGHPDRKEDFTDEEYRFWLNVRNTHAAINGKPQKDYTKAQMLTWYNKLHTDSSEYKMWGNGIALPNALYVMQGISDAISEEKESRSRWLDNLLGDCL